MFLGTSLPAELHNEFNEFIRANGDLQAVKWIPEVNWHITVYFFGGITMEMLENLQSLLELGLKDVKGFELELEKIAFGPSTKSPRMLWARFRKTDEFRMLVNKIHELFLQINPEQQMRKSPLPHVTLARIKNPSNPGKINWPSNNDPKKISITELSLWRSILNSETPEYKLIRQFQLQ
ncbi:MAG: RNA 2',3'-cyclic phosphodiesterase [Bacteroidia bacterium]|nr:RNA 2',3'-cyclic phosphodiesterase [Bacteroidia bacterium]